MRSSAAAKIRKTASALKGVRRPGKGSSSKHLRSVGTRVKTTRSYEVGKIVHDDD